jgi:hypothetical protein
MKRISWRLWVCLGLGGLLASSAARAGTSVRFDLSGQGKFFDLPFPTDLRRNPDGTLKMDDFPNPYHLKTIARYQRTISTGFGYSTAGTIYFHFSGPIQVKNLPAAPADSLRSDAAVFLVDVDPGSPEHGRRIPILTQFYRDQPSLGMGPKNLLAVLPWPGFVLREKTVYAAVVMKKLGDRDGQALENSTDFQTLAQGQTPGAKLGSKAAEVYRPLWAWLKEAGISAEDVAGAAVFTTGDPTAGMLRIFEKVARMPPFKPAAPLQVGREYPDYYVLSGSYRAPQFQSGIPPYKNGKGGGMVFDADGFPRVQRDERVPFVVCVPKGRMPSEGFPLLLYIHGTAGGSTQVVDRGRQPDPKTPAPPGTGPALVLARRGIASAGAALPVSRDRGGDPKMIAFYKFWNPESLRDNIRQSAAEAAMFLRLLEALQIDPGLCPATDASNSGAGKILFDPNRQAVMGQSLGSIVVGIYGAVETDVKAVVPSGAGGQWGWMASKGNYFDSEYLRKRHMGMTELVGANVFHPLLMLLENGLAEADPLSYAPHMIQHPFPGRAPKNVWLALGLYDHYFVPDAQNAIATGLGLDAVGEVKEKSLLDFLALDGHKVLDYPVTGNLKVGDKTLTGAVVQYPQDGILDGHHINFQLDETKYQYSCFLNTLFNAGLPSALAPKPLDQPCVP